MGEAKHAWDRLEGAVRKDFINRLESESHLKQALKRAQGQKSDEQYQPVNYYGSFLK